MLHSKLLYSAPLTFFFGLSRLTPKSDQLCLPASKQHCNNRVKNILYRYIINITCLLKAGRKLREYSRKQRRILYRQKSRQQQGRAARDFNIKKIMIK